MSLYERVSKIIENDNNIDELYNEVKDVLRSAAGIMFPQQVIQAVRIYRGADYIIMEFYLHTISIWVKIYKDSYDASVYINLLDLCQCG